MPASWPSGVPQNTREGSWRLVSPFRAPLRTSLEDGPQRSRRSTSKKISTISFSLIPMTRGQFDDFRAWVADDLFDGTLPEGFSGLVFDGLEYVTRTCRFATDPAYDAQMEGDFVVVSLTLDVEDL